MVSAPEFPMQSPDETELRSLLNGVDIPACPEVLLQLDRELRKDNANQREIARLISRDVALSGHVMQVVNSPLFSTGREITSIMQALTILGTKQVFDLVVVELLRTAMNGSADVSLDRFWDNSARTARLSSEIAKRLRCVAPDMAYTFGLFHDCGMPLLMKRFANYKDVLVEANRDEERGFTEVEEKHLGTNHAVVGYFLARRWKLPDFLAKGILHHHDYLLLLDDTALPPDARAVIAVNAFSEHISRLHAGDFNDAEWVKAASPVSTALRLTEDTVDDLVEDLRDWIEGN